VNYRAGGKRGENDGYCFGDASGHTADVSLKAGQAMYLEAVEHTTQITGNGEIRALLIELK
jgi:hypothetical protein